MMGRTHMLGGAAAGLTVAALTGSMTNPILLGTGMACSVAGSLLPDIDHEQAKLSRMNGLFHAISCAVCSVTKHRQFCHTLCFMLLIGAGLVLLFALLGAQVGAHIDAGLLELARSSGVPLFRTIANVEVTTYLGKGCIFLEAGMLSHLLLDTLNPEGIMWLYPIRKQRYHLLGIKTNSTGEQAVFALLILITGAWLMLLLDRSGALV